MSRADTAARLFTERYSCSQAVFAAFAPELGVDHRSALRLSAGLGGGMRIGSTCGAATGALVVLGLQYCDEECSAESRGRLMRAVETFFERFEDEVGATACPDILGCDFRTQEGKRLMDEQHLRDSVCLTAVRAAVRVLETMPSAGLERR
jgi:C_GCAxxG_C_C family probable redox protein